MVLFLNFLVKLFPLFAFTGLGYLIGKALKLRKEDIANLLIFFFLPFLTFHGMYTTKITAQALSLPLMFFLICTFMALLFLWIGKFVWKDNTPNLLAFASSYGNYSYFAIPASIALFGRESENIIILSAIGFIVFSSTVGYFLTALGSFSIKSSIKKTLLLPSIYTAIAGFLLNYFNVQFGTFAGVDLNSLYNEIMRDMRGCLTVLGMMVLGIAIAEIEHYKHDWVFVGIVFLAQFVIWPIIIFVIIMTDKYFVHFYTNIYYKSFFLLSLIPIGINLIAYATQLKVQPEKAAFTILLSTIFAMIYIPVMIAIFIKFIE